MKRVLIALGLLIAVGCNEEPTEPFPTGVSTVPLLDQGGVPTNTVPFQGVGDCSNAVLIDPGTVTVMNGVRQERGLIAECLFSGDIVGVIRFTRNSTVQTGGGPTSQWIGPVWGHLVITVEEFYGESGLEGTFEGPFRTDWQNLLTGTVKLNRRGTGAFQGLTMVATGQSVGPLIHESGVIHGL